MTRRKDKIDTLIEQALKEKGSGVFKKDPLARKILSALGDPPKWKGIDLKALALHEIKSRLSTALQATDPKTGLRLYECYADGSSGRRWQRFKGMTAGDLRICIAARKEQIHGHERVVAVYEALLTDLEKLGGFAHVEDVYDKAEKYAADAR